MRMTLLASAALLGFAVAGVSMAWAATPDAYLQQAQDAVQQHHPYHAVTALNNAENEILRTGAAEEDRGAREVGRADPTVIRQIARAREAVQNGNWQDAQIYIGDAMTHPSASTAANPATQ